MTKIEDVKALLRTEILIAEQAEKDSCYDRMEQGEVVGLNRALKIVELYESKRIYSIFRHGLGL